MGLATAKKLRKDATDAERLLWRALKPLDVPHTHFRRQVAIGPFVADFACHAARLVVELDGPHNSDSAVESDADPTAFLESRGYHVLRFWNHEVFQNLDAVLETIRVAVEARLKTAQPPPENR